jgi:hypothetical protein
MPYSIEDVGGADRIAKEKEIIITTSIGTDSHPIGHTE